MREPAYLEIHRSGLLEARIDEALEVLADCTVCPRDCHVDRLKNRAKLCHVGRLARVSSHFPHFGEEDCLRGDNGSGTIFFSWCNLKCVFCQNWETSNEGQGYEVTAERLAEMMLELQACGCHNINFVTPEHVVPQILEALPLAIDGGLRLPIVYNTSAYDSLHSLALMDGIVDIYMPDFKYWSDSTSSRLLKARDYPDRARAAIAEMHRQVGDLEVDDRGLAVRGLLVRHLVMPDGLEDTAAILSWLAELSPNTYVNIMDQYRPAGRVTREPERFAFLGRGITAQEHQTALDLARRVGLSRIDVREPRQMMRVALRIL